LKEAIGKARKSIMKADIMISCMLENMSLMLLDISSNMYREARISMNTLRKSLIWQVEISILIPQ